MVEKFDVEPVTPLWQRHKSKLAFSAGRESPLEGTDGKPAIKSIPQPYQGELYALV
jgi:hypothetical protein